MKAKKILTAVSAALLSCALSAENTPVALLLASLQAVAAKEEVKVSEFGWSADDSTGFVQAALDSGAKRVVFDRQAGPWIVRPVKARSNTDIVFEDGVELLAKKGEFHGKRDYLLDMSGVTNVTLVGLGEKGGTLRMRKADYQKPPYVHSEWRYALSLLAAKNVRVENMSFVESGGDGICMGRASCRDIVIKRCRFIANHRQGISVCSVVNLLVEDCVMSDTKGTPPCAGIDFEPDGPGENIVNCTVRNCRVTGNFGKGFDIFLYNQNAGSKTIGIRFENCYIADNGGGTSVTVGRDRNDASAPRGEIVFSGCTFEANRGYAIAVQRKPADFRLLFENCCITNLKGGVTFFNNWWDAPISDGIEFRNLSAYCENGKDWYTPNVNNRGLNATIPGNITGNVTVIRPDGRRENVVLDGEWRRRTFSLKQETPPARVKGIPDESVCTVLDTNPGGMTKLAGVEALYRTDYALFVDKPGEVRLRARQVPKAPGGREIKGPLLPVSRSVGAPPIAHLPFPGQKPTDLVFTAKERGFYFLSSRCGGMRLVIDEANVPTAFYVGSAQQQGYISDSAVHSLYVNIAPGTERFAFVVKGGSDGALAAGLFDPAGKPVAEERQIKAWDVLQRAAPDAGLWRIDLGMPAKGPRRYFQLDLTGTPGFLWLSREKTVSFGK